MNLPFPRREQQVLQGLWDGLSQEQIAARLGIAYGTVKVVLRNAKLRAEAPTTIALLRVAVEQGVLTSEASAR